MSDAFSVDPLALSVERLAVPTLLRGQFATAAREVQAFAEDRHASLSDTRHVACGPGCDRCCVVNVSVLAPEADAIVEFLSQNLSSDTLKELQLRLERLYQQTRWLDDEERIMANHRCAFLDSEGCCVIYPVRPLLCRSLNSVDAEDCRTAMSMLALGQNVSIVSCLEQKEIFETAFIGLGQALRTCGLDDRSWRLSGAVMGRLSGL